jgi:hypothetical protein
MREYADGFIDGLHGNEPPASLNEIYMRGRNLGELVAQLGETIIRLAILHVLVRTSGDSNSHVWRTAADACEVNDKQWLDNFAFNQRWDVRKCRKSMACAEFSGVMCLHDEPCYPDDNPCECADPCSRFIYGQATPQATYHGGSYQPGHVVRNMRFRNTTVAKEGCGPIAIYNALYTLGQHRRLSDIIFEVELNAPGEDIPNSIYYEHYLTHNGFSFETTDKLSDFESWAKDENGEFVEGRVFMIMFWQNESKTSLHIATVRSNDDGTYMTYNLVSGENIAGYNRSLEFIFSNYREFVQGFYITDMEVTS